ncbi:hypothetical protein [Roseateles depolymerans]|uniref:Uncharacterized protein n=1 Tax=Roseateles depolymerans TaxID=76731 RepID=A0A0U3D4J3_9BURK|nr:hypothetical protein [Roseateles depolymerans]ALV08518.1 hypothetical protein RD2015_4069 [Roseateles depolymerans]REG21256.1 hypothetical protein DES44_0370 [Roseateles depolymerans]
MSAPHQLILFELSIQSSYLNNTEAPATEDAFDTIQFFAAEGRAWRIKTFATDQDVHIWELGADAVEDLVELAVGDTEAHYGDVLEAGYVMASETGLDGLRAELDARELPVNLKETSFGAVFWTPPGSQYRTQSRPSE